MSEENRQTVVLTTWPAVIWGILLIMLGVVATMAVASLVGGNALPSQECYVNFEDQSREVRLGLLAWQQAHSLSKQMTIASQVWAYDSIPLNVWIRHQDNRTGDVCFMVTGYTQIEASIIIDQYPCGD